LYGHFYAADWHGPVYTPGLTELGVAVDAPGVERTFPVPSPCPNFRRAAWPLEVRVIGDEILITESGGHRTFICLLGPRAPPE
jgi:hypothetical protein